MELIIEYILAVLKNWWLLALGGLLGIIELIERIWNRTIFLSGRAKLIIALVCLFLSQSLAYKDLRQQMATTITALTRDKTVLLHSNQILRSTINGKDKRIQDLQDQLVSLPRQVEVRIPSVKVQQRPEEKIQEVFDKDNWSQLIFENQPDQFPSIQITLKKAPVPSSLEVMRGSLPVNPLLIKVEGRVIKFGTYSDQFDGDPILVRYYPQEP